MQVVNSVLRCSVEAVVVFGDDENQGIGPGNRFGPFLRVLELVLLDNGLTRFVEQREVDLEQVDEFDLEGTLCAGDVVKPFGDSGTDATGAGATNDDL